MKKLFTPVLLVIFGLNMVSAQRYLTEVFSVVNKTSNVTYGVNATVITIPIIGEAIPLPLQMDVYAPNGDTETARPLLIIVPGGSFLPFPQNKSVAQNSRNDLQNLYMAEEFAKMGYVVAIIGLRLGWNPQAPTQEARATGAVQAAMRQTQDLRTAIRFFRKTVAQLGNPYGIDPEKIAALGDGSGFPAVGFAAYTTDYAADFLSNPNYIVSGPGGVPTPMWVEAVQGDMYALTTGINPANGDTLCYANHVGFNSDFKLAIQFGAALSDTISLTAGDPALISFRGMNGGATPWFYGISSIPGIGPIIEQFGVGLIHQRIKNVGMNAVMKPASQFMDDCTAHQKAVAAANPDLFPDDFPELYALTGSYGSPWVFWDSVTNVNNEYGLLTSPNNHAYSKELLDSMFCFIAPRACLALNLTCDLTGISATKEVLDAASVGLEVSPNPSSDFVVFQTKENTPMGSIYVYDLAGRLVKAHVKIDNSQFTMQRNALTPGLYVAQVKFINGVVTQKIAIK